MIGRLRGKVEAMGEQTAIVDVGGVGYEVACSSRALRNFRIGEEVTLSIDTHVRADAIRLFGFQSEVERSWFRTLQNVQGVGSKVALSILSVLSTPDLATAIALGNWQAVEQANGVGKKLAMRVVAELKDKAPALSIAGLDVPAGTKAGATPPPAEGNAAAEAISALSNLGYQPAQASGAVAVAVRELGADADVAKLIRRSLKELAR
jgi:Holliday junction DNA helicase RuvA